MLLHAHVLTIGSINRHAKQKGEGNHMGSHSMQLMTPEREK